MNSRRHDSATRFVVAIVTVGLVAFVVVVVSGVAVVRRLGETQAVEQARSLTKVEARVVETRIDNGVLTGDAVASSNLAEMISQVVLQDSSVQRVKIWSADGEILYSDETRLIGDEYLLDEEEREVLEHGGVAAEVSSLEGEENRFDQGFGSVTEVYTRIRTPDGTPLLFETYRSSAQIASSGRDIASTYTPVLIGTLLLAALLELTMAAALIRRIRRSQREREALMQEAMDASYRERRRIAGDLHDGPVQEMAGLSLRLAAEAEETADSRTREALLQAAGRVRGSVRTLRSAIVGVYPPNLERTGLETALADLLARLPADEITAHLSYDLDSELEHRASELLYRTGQEAIRNVEKHAGASNVWVTLHRDNGRVALSVHDDGRGGAAVNGQLGDSGRFGLAVLAGIVNDAGGQMRLTSNGGGTTVLVEVPA